MIWTILSVICSEQSTDTDLDRDVDFIDFLNLSEGFGTNGGWRFGNSDLQAGVSLDDFLRLTNNFGFQGSRFVYTYHQPDGNRFVDGWAELPRSTPVDIPLDFSPNWVLGAPVGTNQLWVAVGSLGQVQAFELHGAEFSEVEISPETLSPGRPPILEEFGESFRLIESPGGGATASHPIRLGDELEKTAYISSQGEVVIVETDGPSVPLPVNAMLDARILSDETGKLLVLSDPTTEVPHGVLGDQVEAKSITLIDTNSAPPTISKITVPDGKVVEGISPIWKDIDGDGTREIIVTLSSRTNGGQITVYEENGTLKAQGPGIGRGSRWRHQIAVAPFGIGRKLELVDVLTPHIGGVVEFRAFDETLSILGELGGQTSHVIRSRNLDMAVAADFDSDGIVEFLVPTQQRNTLSAISRTTDGAVLEWQVQIEGVVNSNIGVLQALDGQLTVAVGRTDDTLRVFTR